MRVLEARKILKPRSDCTSQKNKCNCMVKITINHKNYQWIEQCLSFEHGITIAQNLHEKMGLIGRTYILSSCGKQTWIR